MTTAANLFLVFMILAIAAWVAFTLTQAVWYLFLFVWDRWIVALYKSKVRK